MQVRSQVASSPADGALLIVAERRPEASEEDWLRAHLGRPEHLPWTQPTRELHLLGGRRAQSASRSAHPQTSAYTWAGDPAYALRELEARRPGLVVILGEAGRGPLTRWALRSARSAVLVLPASQPPARAPWVRLVLRAASEARALLSWARVLPSDCDRELVLALGARDRIDAESLRQLEAEGFSPRPGERQFDRDAHGASGGF